MKVRIHIAHSHTETYYILLQHVDTLMLILHVSILLFCTNQYCHSHIHMYICIYISKFIVYFYSCNIAVLLILLFMCISVLYMSVLLFFTYVYVHFYFYIIWTCLGIQCGQQRKNFIVQGNLPFLTVRMTINALNLES